MEHQEILIIAGIRGEALVMVMVVVGAMDAPLLNHDSSGSLMYHNIRHLHYGLRRSLSVGSRTWLVEAFAIF